MKLETLLFGDYSKRQIKKITPVAEAVDALADKYSAMSAEELRGTTDVLKGRLAEGETLEQILPDAFAAVREVADRILGKRPFFVQILGGILLHQGRIAEMKTGEGKTLVATMPAYLNALTGKGVHIVTVNEYLADRDATEMGRIYEYLGLTTGVILRDMSVKEKQQQYACDITYGTNSEFGFDYLRDNIAKSRQQLLQRGHNFCIIDEVDSILIDEARTPLIISGTSDETSEIYEKCSEIVRTKLKPKVVKEMDSKADLEDEKFDYIVDEKHQSAVLTPRGEKKVEEALGLDNLNDPKNAFYAHNINQAIHAWGVKKKDRDYVVVDGEVIIVDPFTGRLMPGRRYQDGLHQAIEAKERVNVKGENKVAATVTIQNYFRLYHKLSGMTGTAMTEETEFREIYGIDVVEVPTNKPMIRVDHPDRFFSDEKGKFTAIVKQVIACLDKGQPVLIGTSSVEKSEQLGKMLRAAGVKFNMLNAKDHGREADIIAEAGRPGVVTLATNMAGRGTDIMLGGNPEHMAKQEMLRMGLRRVLIPLASGTAPTDNPDVKNARNTFRILYEKYKKAIEPDRQAVIDVGGLYIIGSERHESRRIDNQLRGRSGRQGDPGESTFFISFQDDVMRLYGDERIRRMQSITATLVGSETDTDLAGNMRIMGDIVEKAQKNVEATNFKRRKNVLEYDDILNEQRKTIYGERNEILLEGDISDKIRAMIASTVEESVEAELHTEGEGRRQITVLDVEALERKYRGWGCADGELASIAEEKGEDGTALAEAVTERIRDNALALYERRLADEVVPGIFQAFQRYILLDAIDDLWLDHIDDMENLQQSVMLQSYAQRDPLNEYKIIGSSMFGDMIDQIRQRVVLQVLTMELRVETAPAEDKRKITLGREVSHTPRRATPARSEEKVKPNDPCPCGSGKKYKKCCGAGKQSGGDV